MAAFKRLRAARSAASRICAEVSPLKLVWWGAKGPNRKIGRARDGYERLNDAATEEQ
jgi:hypothetical protein